jgi:hypothetical protein
MPSNLMKSSERIISLQYQFIETFLKKKESKDTQNSRISNIGLW